MKVLLSIALMALSFGSGQAQSTPPPADGNGYCCGRSTQDSLALCDPCTAGNTCPPAVTCEPMPTYCAAFGLTHCGPFSNACCQGATTIVSACGDRESEEVCFLAPPTTPTPPNTPVPPGGGGGGGGGGTSAGGSGDPHFKTWNSTWYDFHGICDLVLVEDENFANGLGLKIHTRTKGRYEYAFIESAALQIGDNILEVSSFGEYVLDRISNVDMPAEMGGQFLVVHEQKSDKEHAFTIKIGESETIKISTFKDMVSVAIENGSASNFGTSTGLMGKFSDGSLVGRDGTTVFEDHNLFGQEWQVLPSEAQLFQTPSQFIGKTCVPPAATKGRRRLGETVSRDAAEKACDHHQDAEMRDMCIFDVIAMDDLEVANAHGAF